MSNFSYTIYCMREMGAAATTLTEVVEPTAAAIVLVMPASVATAERSFSTLRRMKTYGLLAVMTLQRLRSHDAERAPRIC